MSNFIRVGNKIINVDAITEILVGKPEEPYLGISFMGNEGFLKLEGEEATAVLKYFDSISYDVINDAEPPAWEREIDYEIVEDHCTCGAGDNAPLNVHSNTCKLGDIPF